MSDSRLTLDMPEPELVMWDGVGAAYILGRGKYAMTPRARAITLALARLAVEELEAL